MPKGIFTPLTKIQEQFIRDNYLNLPIKKISDEVNSTFGTIMRKLNKWGLEIPKEVIERNKRKGQFSEGQVSFNKGKTQTEYMSEEAIERTKKTQFKKGRSPHNEKFNGYQRITKDGYIEVRISKGNFQLLHRVNWEKENGSIPSGMILKFIDGNKSNCKTKNLRLIPMSENMIENSNHFTPETVESAKLNYRIKSKIKELENGKK